MFWVIPLVALAFFTTSGKGEPLHDTGKSWMRQITGDCGSARLGQFTLEKVAKVSLAARVLSVRDYNDTPQSLIAPTDIVVCWRDWGHPEISVSQAHRWYFAGPKNLVDEQFFSHTANLHMVGLDQGDRGKIKSGSFILAEGWLVDVRGPNGFFWKTSLSRLDRGDGACEIFLAKRIHVGGGHGLR